MHKINGVGGVFFRAKDPDALSEWYEKNFGINSINSAEVWKQEAGPTVFAPFKATTDYYPAGQQVMLNFRVSDLDSLLEELATNKVKIDEKRETDAIGAFAWVYDPEGNKIELWQPSDEANWTTP